MESEDLHKLFSKYGKLREDGDGVALKKNREWFAFVEFESADSAAEAIKGYAESIWANDELGLQTRWLQIKRSHHQSRRGNGTPQSEKVALIFTRESSKHHSKWGTERMEMGKKDATFATEEVIWPETVPKTTEEVLRQRGSRLSGEMNRQVLQVREKWTQNV